MCDRRRARHGIPMLLASLMVTACCDSPTEPEFDDAAWNDTEFDFTVLDLIAFESQRDGNREIYLMKADGSDGTNLTNNAAADGDIDPVLLQIDLPPLEAVDLSGTHDLGSRAGFETALEDDSLSEAVGCQKGEQNGDTDESTHDSTSLDVIPVHWFQNSDKGRYSYSNPKCAWR